jgi:hypothetical protein
MAAAGGCARKDVLFDRLRAMPDDHARSVLGDCLWAGGSIFRWADHRTARWELTRSDFRPDGRASSDEVWLLDLETGHFRIEKPAAREVTVFNGAVWRVFAGGKETGDLGLRALAEGDAMILRQLATMPFSLTDPGLKIAYVGTRTGPAEAKTWDRLLVTYPPGAGYTAADRTIVEINRATRRVDAVVACWSADPFLGGCYRVEMDEWLPVADLVLARRWRFYPADAKGVALGPVRWEFQVRSAALDVPMKAGAFSGP